MNDFLVPLLIIAIISVVIGFILGGLFSGLGKQTDKTPAQPAARDLTEVVRLWRDDLGLPCFQVAWGDF